MASINRKALMELGQFFSEHKQFFEEVDRAVESAQFEQIFDGNVGDELHIEIPLPDGKEFFEEDLFYIGSLIEGMYKEGSYELLEQPRISRSLVSGIEKKSICFSLK